MDDMTTAPPTFVDNNFKSIATSEQNPYSIQSTIVASNSATATGGGTAVNSKTAIVTDITDQTS